MGAVVDTKEIEFADVQGVIRGSLALEVETEVLPDVKLVEHSTGGEKADEFDLMEICNNLGIPYGNYTSGGALKGPYEDDMKELAKQESGRSGNLLRLAGLKTVQQLVNEICPIDLLAVARYHQRRRLA